MVNDNEEVKATALNEIKETMGGPISHPHRYDTLAEDERPRYRKGHVQAFRKMLTRPNHDKTRFV